MVYKLVVLFISPNWNEDISDTDTDGDNDDNDDNDDDDDDDEFEGRYDRKQNLRDVNDLQQSLRQRLGSSQSVFSVLLSFSFKIMNAHTYTILTDIFWVNVSYRDSPLIFVLHLIMHRTNELGNKIIGLTGYWLMDYWLSH